MISHPVKASPDGPISWQSFDITVILMVRGIIAVSETASTREGLEVAQWVEEVDEGAKGCSDTLEVKGDEV